MLYDKTSLPYCLKGQSFYFTLFLVLTALVFPWSPTTPGNDSASRTAVIAATPSHNHIDVDQLPTIAWLMSFPNSGTSYTLANTYTMSQRLVGTNYNLAARRHSEPFPSSNGPFLLHAGVEQQVPATSVLLPSTFLLTKTHCTGYCVDCVNMAGLLAESFAKGCRTTKERRNNNTSIYTSVYPASIVTRAVHLMRDPFDNLVARMHLSFRDHQGDDQSNNNKSTETVAADDSRQALLTWCRQTVDLHKESFFKSSLVNNDTRLLLQKLPCPLEWYRWIQWHNLALQVTRDIMRIPVHYLYYEQYTSNHNQTVADLLSFLQLSPHAAAVPFVPGKTYRHLYTHLERQTAAQLVRALASPPCWERVKHYFSEDEQDYNISS